MSRTAGVFPVYENQFTVDITGGDGTTEANQKTIADMTSFSVAIDGKVQEWDPMDQEGWTRRLMTGKSITITLNGKRNIGDAGNDYLNTLAMASGTDAYTTLTWTFASGAKLVMHSVVNVTEWQGGETVDVAPLSADFMSDGKPTFTAASASSGNG